MEERKKINIDYLLITELNANGLLFNKEIEIEHSNAESIGYMEDMCKNPNRTVLDLQDVFRMERLPEESHRICLLYDYDEPYVKEACYPTMITFQEYEEKIRQKKSSLHYFEKKNGDHLTEEEIDEYLDEYKKQLKESFFSAAKRYILALDYVKTCHKVSSLQEFKVISTENIGWSVFEHHVGNDIQFTIRTNFGYGRSAYFRTNMRFKGVDILPYSHVVNYAFANMQDLVRATRNYNAVRNNWPAAMKFIAETSNLATQNEEKFLCVWIKNEVDEMMAGLKKICAEPSKMIDEYEKHVGEETPYMAVRNFSKQDVSVYRAEPKEMNISLKATKISGALMFLDNLQAIARVFGYVDKALSELKALAISIIPEVEYLEHRVEDDIQKTEEMLVKEKSVLDEVSKKIQPFEKCLQELINKAVSNHEMTLSIRANFERQNPEYRKLSNEKAIQIDKVRKLENHLMLRKNFLTTLLGQHDTILTQTSKI